MRLTSLPYPGGERGWIRGGVARRRHSIRGITLASWLAVAVGSSPAAERQQSFDSEPPWEGHNNRRVQPASVRQDFGWSPTTHHAGGGAGEMGGFITPAAEPAFYARRISERNLGEPLTASGSLMVEKGSGHTLIGFFNANTLNEWRTPNTMVLRVQQRGEIFHCHLEYCTSKWRAGAGVIGRDDPQRDRIYPKELPCGQVHRWSLRYVPDVVDGRGRLTATLDDETAVCELPPGHKADGAQFNRFGIVNVMKQFDGGGSLWMDDVTINGEREEFATEPRWGGSGNRRRYETVVVRPRFDFGFSPTQHAGGKARGELGGLFFRGDCRYPDRLAAYGDRLERLTLEKPLHASGLISLGRGVTDSTTLIGFYHSRESLTVNPSQEISWPRDFFGAAIEGPSSEGFHFYPVYRNRADGRSGGMGKNPPHIYPNGTSHEWTFDYDPSAAGGNGRVTVSLDGRSVSIDLRDGDKIAGAEFDRFGLVTPWVDGNGQHVYFDDLSYTWRQ